MKNAIVLPLLVSQIEDRKNSKELKISHPDSNLMYAVRSSFVGLLIEAARISHQQTNKVDCLPRSQLLSVRRTVVENDVQAARRV